MARSQDRYVCQGCGAVYAKWQGRCEECGGWNSVVEETAKTSLSKALGGRRGRKLEFVSLQGTACADHRLATGIAELDRVLGGGMVPGSAILIGGDPGIGKSTLLLQTVGALAKGGADCIYISGEEAADQIAMRGRRVGMNEEKVRFAAASDLRDILASLAAAGPIHAVVIDSIQTLHSDTLDSAPGTVAQVRTAAQELVAYAKRSGAAVFLVGHVTKDGQIAGPRVVEHMVDTVLYFEGDRSHRFRILRVVKNRFGATDEIGVFAMTEGGLAEIANPSALFLGQGNARASGAAVFAGIEGSRPLLVEIQALVAASSFATPRRAVVGWDSGRLAMILAVLDARCGMTLSGRDVYLNVAGGLRVNEPAADLAAAAALLSSLANEPLPEDAVVFGEISLAGEVRPVAHTEARIKEAAKLGFTQALIPFGSGLRNPPLRLTEMERLSDLLALFPPVEKRVQA